MDISFFVQYQMPYRILIVQNELIGFQEYYGSILSRERNYHLLWLLYRNKKTRKAFPEELLAHFKSTSYNDSIFTCPCLSGNFIEHEFVNCFISKLEIVENNTGDVKVRLFDFGDINRDWGYFLFLKYQYEICLLLEKAFMIMANLCADTSLLYGPMEILFSKNHTNPGKLIRSYLQQNDDRSKNEKKALESKLTRDSLSFTADYLEYLLDKLATGFLTPEIILENSGLSVLAFLADVPIVGEYILEKANELLTNHDSLSRNEQVLYLSLVMKCKKTFVRLLPEIWDFYHTNYDFLKKIESNLTKKFVDLVDAIDKDYVQLIQFEDAESFFKDYGYKSDTII